MRRPLVLLLALVLAGCGSSASKQAEDLQSLAAEGALMAHDAGEGDAWGPYTRAHAHELAQKASSLATKAKTRELSVLARLIAGDLRQLERSDRVEAQALERRLGAAAKRAGMLA